MNALMIKAMICLQLLKNRFFEEEQGDVNVVSIVVLIGVAVLLAILFKGQITTLLTNLFTTIGSNANDAINN